MQGVVFIKQICKNTLYLNIPFHFWKNQNKFASLWCRDFCGTYGTGKDDKSFLGFYPTLIIIPLTFKFVWGKLKIKRLGSPLFSVCVLKKDTDIHEFFQRLLTCKAFYEDRKLNCGNKNIYSLCQICLRFFAESQWRTSGRVLWTTNTKQ